MNRDMFFGYVFGFATAVGMMISCLLGGWILMELSSVEPTHSFKVGK